MATIFPSNPTVGDTYNGYMWTGTAWDITGVDLTASYQPLVASVSNTELGYLDGVTSAIQTQLDAKIASSAASANQLVYKNSSNVATGSSGLTYDGTSIKVNGNLESVYHNGDEGGEIFLHNPDTNTTLSNGVTIDVFRDKLRIFENGSPNRGGYIDLGTLPNGVSTNLVPALVSVIPSSVTVGSGSGSVATNGAVTFSGASSVSINNCFSSTYDSYRVVVTNLTQSAANNLLMRLRVSGADNTTSAYHTNRIEIASGVSSPVTIAGASYNSPTYVHSNSGSFSSFSIDFINPNKVAATSSFGIAERLDSGSNIYTIFYGGLFEATTAFDGFSLVSSTGTLTGTIRIYGYSNGGA